MKACGSVYQSTHGPGNQLLRMPAEFNVYRSDLVKRISRVTPALVSHQLLQLRFLIIQNLFLMAHHLIADFILAPQPNQFRAFRLDCRPA
jgi:hypothetical protein